MCFAIVIHVCLCWQFFINCFSPQVLLCFSRDTAVLEHFNYNSATPPKSRIQSNVSECLSLLQSSDIFLSFYPVYNVVFFSGKSGSEQCAVVYPPNGERTPITSICIIACPSVHYVLVHLLNSLKFLWNLMIHQISSIVKQFCNNGNQYNRIWPVCPIGVIPFHGFSMYGEYNE